MAGKGSFSGDKQLEPEAKEEFINKYKKAVDNEEELRNCIVALCDETINGSLSPLSVVSTLSEVATLDKAMPSILADVLLLYDLETQASERKDLRDRYIRLLSSCCDRLVANYLLKERLDTETAGEAYIIPDKKAASTKFIKLKTRIFYKQQKYNLLREESEGYSKLIIELNQDEEFDVQYMLKVIRSLIGCFNLDPNRVLDIILECFENRPELRKSYICLIQKFFENSTTLSQLVALKLSYYKPENQRSAPDSLYLVIAMMIQDHLLNIDEIYPYLAPSDSLIQQFCKHELAEALIVAKKPVIIVDDKPKEEKFTKDEEFALVANNQKLGLCTALLEVGAVSDAMKIAEMLPEYYAVSNVNVAVNLANVINVGLDKIYRENSGLPPLLVGKIALSDISSHCSFRSVETYEEYKTELLPLVIKLGAFVYYDSVLISKLMRISRSFLKADPSTMDDALSVLSECILPALSLTVSNCGISEELWCLLKELPYMTRYTLYFKWNQDSSNPTLIKTRGNVLRRVKYIMKRLSKENLKLSGRQIGKLSHSNPTILFDYVLSQIQSYDNLIGPVVDSLKFLTSVAYDVLIYCLIEALADPRKDRTKHDGASMSPWLLSLANFCGSMAKKYPVELPGLLQFIANQLKAERSLDLIVLKEIVNKMAGIEVNEQLKNEQLAALSGGELLRAECGYFNQVRNTRKSSMRLKDCLVESDLVMPLCMLMAQQRHCILFTEQENSHLKLIGKLYDQCQETLVQYGSFLSVSLSIEDYIKHLPSLEKLITDYHLSSDVAFFLVRPMIMHHITLKYQELRRGGDKPSTSSEAYMEAWDAVTDPIVEAVIPALSWEFWDDLSARLYITFWTLNMYDLEVPKASYGAEVERLKQLIQVTEENKDLPASKKKKEVERGRLLQEKLLEEQLKQDQHVLRVRHRLEGEKEQWFTTNSVKSEMMMQFLQYCLFPRCIFTAADALYCAKFVHMVHTLQTPNFSTLVCLDRIFCDISYTMCSCTENEANNYGRFLASILDIVMRWHKDIDVFNKECAKFPGFVKKFTDKDPEHADYEDYRHVCHKWHYRMTKAFILCLESEDYVQIRNSLLVLLKIQAYFPVIINYAQAITRRIENTRKNEKDKRPDLYVLATGYSGMLKMKKA
ncbi:THO complex subunit 2 [Halotydeus destructor]|nr:THO complex subunit 2 [Halotydeus destructor]